MSIILAIETSTVACSVALNIDGKIIENFQLIPREHASSLLPMIAVLMEQNNIGFDQLDAVAFGRGPGSFTGLRIATGVTQGIAFGASIPTVPISTLMAMARRAYLQTGKNYIISCMDARIEQIYWSAFQVHSENSIESQSEEILSDPEELVVPECINENSWYGAGNGWNYADRMPELAKPSFAEFYLDILPHAADIAALAAGAYLTGKVERAENIAPVYLRDKVTNS